MKATDKGPEDSQGQCKWPHLVSKPKGMGEKARERATQPVQHQVNNKLEQKVMGRQQQPGAMQMAPNHQQAKANSNRAGDNSQGNQFVPR